MQSSELVMGRYTENTKPISDIVKTDTILTSVFGIPKNTEYRQLNTEKSVRFSILYIYTARKLAAQCIVIGPVYVFVCLQQAGGRCPNLTTGSVRSVCVSPSAFSSSLFH